VLVGLIYVHADNKKIKLHKDARAHAHTHTHIYIYIYINELKNAHQVYFKILCNFYQYTIWDICSGEDSYCDLDYEAT
jgi:hypothetical protein